MRQPGILLDSKSAFALSRFVVMVLFSMATSCLFVCYVDVVVDIEPLWMLARVLEVFEYLSGRIYYFGVPLGMYC